MNHVLYDLHLLSWVLNHCMMCTMRKLKLEVDTWLSGFDMTLDSLWVM
jgi:hypothetical protein